MTTQSILIPVETRNGFATTMHVNGRIYRERFAGRWLRFFVDVNGTVSDVRSGWRIGDVNAIKVERMARISTYTKTTDRQAAVIMIDRIIERVGAERFWQTVDAAPTLNPTKRAR